jgi:peptidoglycan/LPS O-acetylase OafA/YrhL
VKIESSKHFILLDFYRYLAAFGVLLLHFTEFARYDQKAGVGLAVFNFYLFVDFFFILSGFVIGVSYFEKVDTPSKIFIFLRRRIARIYPLHILTLTLYLLPAIVGLSFNPAKYRLNEIASQILLYQSWCLNQPAPLNFPAWSISVEWGMYLLFPALVLIARGFGNLGLMAIIAIGFWAHEVVLRDHLVTPNLWFVEISLIRALPTFSIGLLISRSYRMLQFPYGEPISVSAFCAAIGSMLILLSPYITIGLFSVTIITAAAARYQLFSAPILKQLGDASYGLYMFHSITLAVAAREIWPRLYPGHVPPLWQAFLIGGVTTVVALIMFRVFEKPARRFISGGPWRWRHAEGESLAKSDYAV